MMSRSSLTGGATRSAQGSPRLQRIDRKRQQCKIRRRNSKRTNVLLQYMDQSKEIQTTMKELKL